MMPMFGANTANRQQPAFARVADAATSKIDGDRLDLNWVDWDNDRHQDGWLSYMNLGVASWRTWLGDRIADVIQRYGVDAYFLDIVGGWVNNPKADMHEGTRQLVAGSAPPASPAWRAVGEMHYDALLEFIPMYHSFGQTLVADMVQRHAQVLPAPEPSRAGPRQHRRARGRVRPLESANAVAHRDDHPHAECRGRHVRPTAPRWTRSFRRPSAAWASDEASMAGLVCRHHHGFSSVFQCRSVLVDVRGRHDVDARVDDRRRRHPAGLDVGEQTHRLAAPAEILLTEQHLHLARA